MRESKLKNRTGWRTHGAAFFLNDYQTLPSLQKKGEKKPTLTVCGTLATKHFKLLFKHKRFAPQPGCVYKCFGTHTHTRSCYGRCEPVTVASPILWQGLPENLQKNAHHYCPPPKKWGLEYSWSTWTHCKHLSQTCHCGMGLPFLTAFFFVSTASPPLRRGVQRDSN